MRRLAVLSVAVLMLSACGDGQGARGVDGSNEHSLGADSGLFPGSAMWSPDGGKLAIIEDYPFGMEPDIWVVDIASGERTNLTDDGVVQAEWPSPGEFVYPDGAVVDLFPSWSADGERIRFLREYSDGMTLMSIPAGGGDPTRLGSINADWKKLQTVAWAENSIAWTSGTPDDRHSEVWVSSGFGGLPHKVLDGPYRVLSFSADGALLLADQLDRSSEGAVGTARVVPARGGDAVPVASGDVQYPTWGPEGHAIAYVDTAVKVVGKPGDQPRVLYEGNELAAADHRSLDWARGALLVRSGRGHTDRTANRRIVSPSSLVRRSAVDSR